MTGRQFFGADSLIQEVRHEIEEAAKYGRELDLTWKLRTAIEAAQHDAWWDGYSRGLADYSGQQQHVVDLARLTAADDA